MSDHDLRERTIARVRCAMTAAMRTDPHALDRLVLANVNVLNPHSASFARTARTLTLATSAALTTILTAHRHGRDAHDRLVCLACGIGRCRTVRNVSDVLAAYGLAIDPVDRADAWFARTAVRPVPLSVEAFEGFVARPAALPSGNILVVDRHTGTLTEWPPLDTGTLAGKYHDYKRGIL